MNMIKSALRLVERYNSYTEQNPAKSIIITTGVIMGAGDLLIQEIERFYERKNHEGDKSYKATTINKMRIAHMFIYGITFLGPFSFYWYTHALPRIAPITIQGNKSQIFKKILIDQTVGNGIQYSSFLLAMTLLGGKSITDDSEKLKQDFIQCCVSDGCVWPWIQFFNFKYVPIHMQALVVNAFSVFWNAYISKIHHTKIEIPSEEEETAKLFQNAMLSL